METHLAAASVQLPSPHSSAALIYDSTETRFAAFKATYSKSYTNAEHERKAFSAFAENDAFILAHNAKQSSYKLGHNEFSDLSSEEFMALGYVGGYKPEMKPNATVDWSLADPKRVAAAPTEIDWATKGAVTPVKNQGG